MTGRDGLLKVTGSVANVFLVDEIEITAETQFARVQE